MSDHDWHVLIETLAWSLIHFIWQGALIAFVLWLALGALSGRSAKERYLVRCAAFCALALAPVATFSWLWSAAPEAAGVSSLSGAALPQVNESGTLRWDEPLTWVVLAWCAGAGACILRLVSGLAQVMRLRRMRVGIDLSPRWQRRFDALARDFGVRARARVVESASVCVPAVIGCVRPVVMLPARLFTGLSDAQIEALLAHELAHVARHDYLVNIVQTVVESLLFYHPAVWWVSRGIRVEREYCCDDLAVAATRNGLAYAHALTALEEWRGAQPQLGVSTLGGALMSRIQRLVGVEPTRPARVLRPTHALASLFVVGTLGASAYAFAAGPVAPACDCKCACHARARKHDGQRIDRLRLLDGGALQQQNVFEVDSSGDEGLTQIEVELEELGGGQFLLLEPQLRGRLEKHEARGGGQGARPLMLRLRQTADAEGAPHHHGGATGREEDVRRRVHEALLERVGGVHREALDASVLNELHTKILRGLREGGQGDARVEVRVLGLDPESGRASSPNSDQLHEIHEHLKGLGLGDLDEGMQVFVDARVEEDGGGIPSVLKHVVRLNGLGGDGHGQWITGGEVPVLLDLELEAIEEVEDHEEVQCDGTAEVVEDCVILESPTGGATQLRWVSAPPTGAEEGAFSPGQYRVRFGDREDSSEASGALERELEQLQRRNAALEEVLAQKAQHLEELERQLEEKARHLEELRTDHE